MYIITSAKEVTGMFSTLLDCLFFCQSTGYLKHLWTDIDKSVFSQESFKLDFGDLDVLTSYPDFVFSARAGNLFVVEISDYNHSVLR